MTKNKIDREKAARNKVLKEALGNEGLEWVKLLAQVIVQIKSYDSHTSARNYYRLSMDFCMPTNNQTCISNVKIELNNPEGEEND